MQKSQIHPTILQPFLDSAANAADKGQAQWLTPPEWGRVLSRPLVRLRPVITDLSCGTGALLRAARTTGSQIQGCDIQPHGGFVAADVADFYPLLRAVDWRGDCFVLNPPWDLHWYRNKSPGSGRSLGSKVSGLKSRSDGGRETPDSRLQTPDPDPRLQTPDPRLVPEVAGLSLLADSDCPAVREAWAARDPRLGKDTIDSTSATLMLALDRMAWHGEGFLIANEATLQRLLFHGPHQSLARHVWAHLVVAGNICMGKAESRNRKAESRKQKVEIGESPTGFPLSTFQTGILWFARSHEVGLTTQLCERTVADLVGAQAFCDFLCVERHLYRTGVETRAGRQTLDSVALWEACATEWRRINPHTPERAPAYHLWLGGDGCIRTNLSRFDTASGRVDKAQADQLHELTGREPLKLVVMRESRKALMWAAGVNPGVNSLGSNVSSLRSIGPDSPNATGRETPDSRLQTLDSRQTFKTLESPWRVCPQLQAAVRQALADYNAARTPLYPLPEIQRLAFCDEHDFITCTQSLGLMSDSRPQTQACLFRAGERYALRSVTVIVKRQGEKVNLNGEAEAVELDGLELAIFLTGEDGREYCFMEGRLRDPNVAVSLIKPGVREGLKRLTGRDLEPCPIDFTVQELIAHFDIPEVPDVAQVFPQQYQQHLQTLNHIEQLVNENKE